MPKGWRIFLEVVGSVLFLSITIIFLSYRLLTKSLPQTSGSINIESLEQSVQIYRDAYSIPHIFAQNERDLFRAQGFATAQDRLWQMDLARRAANGTLSEIFGETTLENDKFFRLIGFKRIAEKIVEHLSPESYASLNAYAEGVNAYIHLHEKNLPNEFALLHYKPDPWKIVDSVALLRLLAWKLSLSWYVDPVLQKLVDKLGLQRAKQVFPELSEDPPYIVPHSASSFRNTAQSFLLRGLSAMNTLKISGGRPGSNAWVVSGVKTVSGKPILANDPHLEMTVPSVWYEVHLSGGGIDAAGVTMPGIPGVMIGHNKKIAWGVTNGMIDDVDFYLEKTHPDSTNLYLAGRQWRTFSTITEEIAVKDAEPVKFSIVATRNGPVVSSFQPVLKKKDEMVSMKWVGQEPSDEMAAVLGILKSSDWQEFTQALTYLKVPAQNYFFASVDGDIGYHLAGKIPVRQKTTGILLHPGWSEKGQWSSYIPFEKLAQRFNPPEGYLFAANNNIVGATYPYYLSNLWEPPSRAQRIQQWLSGKAGFTIDDFKRMQQDVNSPWAGTILPIVCEIVKRHLEKTPNETLNNLYHLIKDWDGAESPQSVETSILHAFFVKLAENTLKDEMGEELYHQYIQFANIPFRVMTHLLEKPSSPWFDDVKTPEVETMKDVVIRSLLDANTFLRNIAGDDLVSWRWGEIHQLTFRHPLAVKHPLDFILNRGPFSRGGSVMTINNTQYRFDRPFDVSLAPSTRQLIDLADIEHTFSIIAPGQSGQCLSDHFDDQLPLWLQGQYHFVSMNQTEISAVSKQHLILKPKLIK